MPHVFCVHKESIKRKFGIYVVVAKNGDHASLYVGKVGDNRDGCNPVISRCGNHFSYNRVHSQVRNKIGDHEDRDYTYVFEHIADYVEEPAERRSAVEMTNEMERWLMQEIESEFAGRPEIAMLNPYKGSGYLTAAERVKRATFRTPEARAKIQGLVDAVVEVCAGLG